MCGSISPVASRSVRRPRPRIGRVAGLVVLRTLAAQRAVAGRGQPLGDLVERSGGDDQDAEDAEEQQERHHDVRRAEQVEEEGGDDVADGAAALAQRAGVAGDRLRVALGDVHDAEQPQAERAPADDLPAGRAVADRVAQVAPADDQQHQRHQPADLADGAGDGDADRAHDRAAELEPDRGGADDRQREDEEADTVAAVLGLEVAGAVADPAGDRADAVGDREPDGGDAAEDGVEEPGDRSPAGADGAGCRAPVAAGRTAPAAARGRLPRRLLLLARRGSALLPGTPCSRRRGPLRRSGPASRTRRGRRTGRHVNTLGNRHTSHRDHRSACRAGVGIPGRPGIWPRSGVATPDSARTA